MAGDVRELEGIDGVAAGRRPRPRRARPRATERCSGGSLPPPSGRPRSPRRPRAQPRDQQRAGSSFHVLTSFRGRPVAGSHRTPVPWYEPGVSARSRPCNGSYLRRIHGVPRAAAVGRGQDRRPAPLCPPISAVIQPCPARRRPGRSGEAVDHAAFPAARRRPACEAPSPAGGCRPGTARGRPRPPPTRRRTARASESSGVTSAKPGSDRPASATPPPAARPRPHRRWCRRRRPGCRRPEPPSNSTQIEPRPGHRTVAVSHCATGLWPRPAACVQCPAVLERARGRPGDGCRPRRTPSWPTPCFTTAQLAPPSLLLTNAPRRAGRPLPGRRRDTPPVVGVVNSTCVSARPAGSAACDQLAPPSVVRSSEPVATASHAGGR